MSCKYCENLIIGMVCDECGEVKTPKQNIARFSDLIGHTLTAERVNGDEVELEIAGRKFVLAHSQDCCESVKLVDVCGEMSDLLAGPILQAEESSSPGGDPPPENPDSWTWTFYRISTNLGQVVFRWLGESNGYYSETVDFNEVVR